MSADNAFKKIIAEISEELGAGPEDVELIPCRQLFDAGVAYADSITPNDARATLDKAVRILLAASPSKSGPIFVPGSEADKLLIAVDEVHNLFYNATRPVGPER